MTVSFTIKDNKQYPSINGIFCKPIDLSIRNLLRKAKKPQEDLTGEKAVKILRSIEIRSKIQSFFTKPVVAIGFALTATIAGYIASAFAAFSIALAILGITVAVTGTMALSLTIKVACDGSLNRMSEAYAERAKVARENIDEIKKRQKGNKLIVMC